MNDPYEGLGIEEKPAATDPYAGLGVEEKPAAMAVADPYAGLGVEEKPATRAAADPYAGLGVEEKPAATAASALDDWKDATGPRLQGQPEIGGVSKTNIPEAAGGEVEPPGPAFAPAPPSNWKDALHEGMKTLSFLPFSDASQVVDAAFLLKAARNVERGEATYEEEEMLNDYLQKAQRPKTIGYNIISNILKLPAFAGEMLMTAGAYTAPKALAAAGIKGALAKYAETAAGRAIVGVGSRAAGVAAQTAASSAQRVVAGTLQNITPTVERGDYAGEDNLTAKSDEDTLVKALARSFTEQALQVGSERLGNLLDRTPPAKIFQAALRRYLRINPSARVENFMDMMRNRALRNSFVAETLEEEVIKPAEVLTGAGTQLRGEENTMRNRLREQYSLRQFLEQSATLAVPGAAGVMINRLGGLPGVKAQEPEGMAVEQSEAARAAAMSRGEIPIAPGLPAAAPTEAGGVPVAPVVEQPVVAGDGKFRVAAPTDPGKAAVGHWAWVDLEDPRLKAARDKIKAIESGLQDRDRRRVSADVARVKRLNEFEASWMLDAPTSDRGGPILDAASGAPVAGYGRLDTLDDVYNLPDGDPRKAALLAEYDRAGAQLGLGGRPAEMRRPILARLAEGYEGTDAPGFAVLSNMNVAQGYSDAEQSGRDARLILDNNLLDVLKVGEDNRLVENREFVSRYLELTENGAQLSDRYGKPIPELVEKRLQRALLTILIRENPVAPDVITALTERADEYGLRNMVDGLAAAAPELVKLRVDRPEFDLTPELSATMPFVLEAKRAIRADEFATLEEYFQQQDFYRQATEEQKTLALILAGAKSSKWLREKLENYAAAARKMDVSTQDMFSDLPQSRKIDLLKRIIADTKLETALDDLDTVMAGGGVGEQKTGYGVEGSPRRTQVGGQVPFNFGNQNIDLTPEGAKARLDDYRKLQPGDLPENADAEDRRWGTIEHFYKIANRAEQIFPGQNLKDIYLIEVSKGHYDDQQVLDAFYVRRNDENKALDYISKMYPPGSGTDVSMQPGLQPYQSKAAGYPKYEDWKKGAQADLNAARQESLKKQSDKAAKKQADLEATDLFARAAKLQLQATSGGKTGFRARLEEVAGSKRGKAGQDKRYLIQREVQNKARALIEALDAGRIQEEEAKARFAETETRAERALAAAEREKQTATAGTGDLFGIDNSKQSGMLLDKEAVYDFAEAQGVKDPGEADRLSDAIVQAEFELRYPGSKGGTAADDTEISPNKQQFELIRAALKDPTNETKLRAALDAGAGRISNLIPALIHRRIPGFRLEGKTILSTKDFAELAMTCRSRLFEIYKVAVVHKGKVVYSNILSVGMKNYAPVEPAVVIQAAQLAARKSGAPVEEMEIYLAHNHPGDNPDPSPDDKMIAKEMDNACWRAGLRAPQHINTNGGEFYRYDADKTEQFPIYHKTPEEVMPEGEIKKISESGEFVKIANALRRVNKDYLHILYLSYQNRIRQIETMAIKDIQGIEQEISRTGSLLAAGAVMIIHPATERKAALRDAQKIIKTLAGLKIKLLDISTVDKPSWEDAGILNYAKQKINNIAEASGEYGAGGEMEKRERVVNAAALAAASWAEKEGLKVLTPEAVEQLFRQKYGDKLAGLTKEICVAANRLIPGKQIKEKQIAMQPKTMARWLLRAKGLDAARNRIIAARQQAGASGEYGSPRQNAPAQIVSEPTEQIEKTVAPAGTGWPGGELGEPKQRGTPPEDNPNFSTLPLELPELVQFGRALLEGKYPEVRRKLGNALGRFVHRDIAPEGKIELLASVFQLVTDEEKARMKEEAKGWAEQNATATDNVSELEAARYEYLYNQTYEAAKARNPLLASKVLAHEIGHAVSWLPEHVVRGRGNILGQIASFVDYTKRLLAALPHTGSILTDIERRRIRAEAQKRAGKDAKRVPEIYVKMIASEIKRRGLVTREEIVEELKPLLAWWRGHESMEPYFKQPHEMYAEALSVLLNNPAALAKRAPKFYKLFFGWFENKPEVKKLYNAVQDSINSGAIYKQRVETMYREMAEADRAAAEMATAVGKMTGREIKDQFVYTIDRRFGPIQRRIATIKDPEIRRKALGALSDNQYRGSLGELIMDRVQNEVTPRLMANNFQWVNLGEYLFHQRIQYGDRADIGNPWGMTPKASLERLEEMRKDYGPERYAALEEASLWLRAIYEQEVLGKAREFGVYDDSMMQMLEDNVFYATFAVFKDQARPGQDSLQAAMSDRFGNGVTSHIFKQYGTLKPVKNPATATVQKMLAISSMLYREHAKKAAVEAMLGSEYAGEWQPAETQWTGRRHEIKIIENEQIGTLVYLDGGKLHGYYGPRALVDAFSFRNPIETILTARVASTLSSWLKGVFTSANPGFWLVALIRDIRGFNRRMPGTVTELRNWIPFTGGVYGRYAPRALRAAGSMFAGRPNATGMAALRRGMVISRMAGYMGQAEDDEFEREIKRRGLPVLVQEDMPQVRRALNMAHKWMELGQVFERMSKIAGMLYLDEKHPDMPEEQKRVIVRKWAGSPDFLEKAAYNWTLDWLALFYNPAKEGLRSEVQAWKGFGGEKGRAGEMFWNTLRWSILPTLGWMMMYELGSSGGDDDDENEKMYADGPSERDKRTYRCIPLGWVDKKEHKAAYLRLPLEENERIINAIFYTAVKAAKTGKIGEALPAITDYAGRQLPGVNPILGLVRDWGVFMAGRNPYDYFRGMNVLSENEQRSRGDDITTRFRGTGTMLKYTWNAIPGALIGQIPPAERPEDVATTSLEKMLRLPGISNLVGRWIKISNAGRRERMKKSSQPMEQREAEIRSEIEAAIIALKKTGKLDSDCAVRLAQGKFLFDRFKLELLPPELALQRYYYIYFIGELKKAAISQVAPLDIRIMMNQPTQAQKMSVAREIMQSR